MLSAGVALAAYLATRAPGLGYTDAGELAAAAATLGVPHPTGAPAFVLFAFPWTKLPWASVIGGLNVLAGVWVAGCVGLAHVLGRSLIVELQPQASRLHQDAPAAVGALCFAFAPAVWSQATSIEVYALHALLLAATAWALRWRRWVGALGLGLLLSNHASSVFLVPGLVAWALWRRPRPSWGRIALELAPAAAVPVALYGLLALRAAQLPPLNWGWIHRDWTAFWYHVSGAQFRVWLSWDPTTVGANLAVLGQAAAGLTLVVGALPAVAGAWALRRTALAPLGLLAGGNLAGTLGYGIPDLEPYFLPALLVLALWLAVGLSVLTAAAPRWVALAALALPLASAGLHAREQDLSDHRALQHYASWVLANLPPNAVLLTQEWDVLCGPLWYLQAVEGVRPDVLVIDKELLRRSWYLPHLLEHARGGLDALRPVAARYLELLGQFEREGEAFTRDSARVAAIQAAFEGVLRALVTQVSGRPVFASNDVLGSEATLREGFGLTLAGPVVRLGVAPTEPMRPALDALPALVASLEGRTGRLDRQLALTAARGVAGSAMALLEQWHDEAGFRQLRRYAHQLAPQAPFLAHLDRALPP